MSSTFKHLPVLFLSLSALGIAATHAAAPDSALPKAESSGRPIAAVIDDYIKLGLASNLALANQSLETQKSLAALTTARSRFFPEVALNARYTRADGGREITLPVSQLLNPAYQTLNELLIASGGTPRFPLLGDESFPLQLPREQDTRITLRQPLYAPAIPAALAAARARAGAADFAQQAFARQLRRDIAIAYLTWLRAHNGAQIIAASAALLEENLRVNQSLHANGKSTRDAVLRAEAELLAVRQQQAETDNGAAQARSYVNFLLNRPLDTPLDLGAFDVLTPPTAVAALEEATHTAQLGRPELRQLEAAGRAADAQLRAARAAHKPTLSLGVDAGTEGSDYGLGRKYNFASASLVVNWTLFDGGARSATIAEARLSTAQLRNQQQQAAARIELEVRQAYDNLRTASESVATAQARAAAARAAFAIASRRRDAGMASALEFLDARSALTGAELNENQSRCELLQRRFEFDYARGDSP